MRRRGQKGWMSSRDAADLARVARRREAFRKAKAGKGAPPRGEVVPRGLLGWLFGGRR